MLVNRLALAALLLGLIWLPSAYGAGDENAAQLLSRQDPPGRDIGNADNKALYCVGYAHLDTQWRWDFVKTIDDYVRNTLDENFALFEKYPEYIFNFTGSVRYEMMKEYYPQRFQRLKQYIADGRWYVSGSSVDEGDVNVPSPESIIRQVLYGNLYFKREFGKVSNDYMLPDCFGFPASMPSLWAHCGLLGFSTQKLTWGSAVGIPFPVGVWEGPDGNSVLAALDPGPYVGAIKGRVDQNADWLGRVDRHGKLYGMWADYHYYGVGDIGGAPREKDVQNYIASGKASDRKMDVALATSEQLFHDITPGIRSKLPRFKGDMLLTEHSAGTLTSQSYMKRWNRKAEQLADAAERAASIGYALGQMDYPREKLERAWVRLLANQMHDILPGTSIPRAYRYSWNDDVIALNLFADVLTHAVGRVSSQLDTQVEGRPLVVFNPLDIERIDVVEATLPNADSASVRVFDDQGREVPSQIVARDGGGLHFIFLASMPANSFAVYDVRPADKGFSDERGPRVSERGLENERYRVRLNEAGDIAEVFDKRHNRNVLSKPATLQFTYERPRSFPAWNMDWTDRQNPPVGQVDGTPSFRVVENGPVRATIAVTRWARDSKVTQFIQLLRGESGDLVEVAAEIDWQSTQCALKAAFPLSVSNQNATYNWGMGTIERGNNEPKKYEVPSHEWFDLTDRSGDYGVSILEDSKFGSDKPTDNEVRLTLLYTPGVRGSYMDQHSQDWGVHEMRYAIFGHVGDWRAAQVEWRGRRFNQALRGFWCDKHSGRLGRTFAFATSNTPQVDIRAIKCAEESDRLVVRVQELMGKPAKKVAIEFPFAITTVDEVDGQERKLASLAGSGKTFQFDIGAYGMRSFAFELERGSGSTSNECAGQPIALEYNADVVSTDADRADGDMDGHGRSYPAEMFPSQLTDNGITFQLGSTQPGEKQVLTCKGQRIDLKNAKGNEIHLLVAATEDVTTTFTIGERPHRLGIQAWTGFVGQWYDRVFDRTFGENDHHCDGKVVSILPAFIKRDPIAWFATHRHHPANGNESYRFSYLYHYVLPRCTANEIVLPYDERVRVFALTIADGSHVTAAAPLYDDFTGSKPITVRHRYAEDQLPVFGERNPNEHVAIARAQSFAKLTTMRPRNDDDIDASTGDRFNFKVFAPIPDLEIHHQSGVVDGTITRLNDGEVSQNNDDTRRSIWYDNEGRFTLGLQQRRKIQRIDTYSWHVSDRAPQYFSVWGSYQENMPPADFKAGGQGDRWELIAIVDTRALGDGGVHATRIERGDRPMGPYRHLLWVCEDMGHGTFFTEIDMDFAE